MATIKKSAAIQDIRAKVIRQNYGAFPHLNIKSVHSVKRICLVCVPMTFSLTHDIAGHKWYRTCESCSCNVSAEQKGKKSSSLDIDEVRAE